MQMMFENVIMASAWKRTLHGLTTGSIPAGPPLVHVLGILCSLQVVIFSEGDVSLNKCDFSESNATVLVDNNVGKVIIRNTILGDNNYCELVLDSWPKKSYYWRALAVCAS